MRLFIGLMRLVGAESQPAGSVRPAPRPRSRPAIVRQPQMRHPRPWRARLLRLLRRRLLRRSRRCPRRRPSHRRSRPRASEISLPPASGSVALDFSSVAVDLPQFPVGGSSIVCHVCSSVALRARFGLCVHTPVRSNVRACRWVVLGGRYRRRRRTRRRSCLCRWRPRRQLRNRLTGQGGASGRPSSCSRR